MKQANSVRETSFSLKIFSNFTGDS